MFFITIHVARFFVLLLSVSVLGVRVVRACCETMGMSVAWFRRADRNKEDRNKEKGWI